MTYGTKSSITIIDPDTKSYREVIEKYRKGVVVSSKTTYCMRIKVQNEQQELKEFLNFRKEKGEKFISFGREYPREFDGTWYYIVKEFRD